MVQEDNHCNRQYQRFMDLEERASNPGQNAYCLVEDNKCPYYATSKNQDYCRLSIGKMEEQNGRQTVNTK